MPQRFTSITRPRFRELVKGMVDGSLLKKWDVIGAATTKAEKVEERQIKIIGMIYGKHDEDVLKVLESDAWTVLHIDVINGNFVLRVESNMYHNVAIIKRRNDEIERHLFENLLKDLYDR